MREDHFADSELGTFDRFFGEDRVDGERYPGLYFTGAIRGGFLRGVNLSLEGPTADEARLLLPRARSIAEHALPSTEMFAALLAAFPEVFPWQQPRDMSYLLEVHEVCVGRRGDLGVAFDVDTDDVDLTDYWPLVWLSSGNEVISAHYDGGRGGYPGGRDYSIPDQSRMILRGWEESIRVNRS